MLALYAARIEDLGRGDLVKLDCAALPPRRLDRHQIGSVLSLLSSLGKFGETLGRAVDRSSRAAVSSSVSGSASSVRSFRALACLPRSAARAPTNRALAGETVTFKSEFFDFQNVRVTPEPIQKPRPPIWLGGFTPAALRRAVRFGDGFTVPGANRDVYDRYVAELTKKTGRQIIFVSQAAFGF
jgi:hypothetical protein